MLIAPFKRTKINYYLQNAINYIYIIYIYSERGTKSVLTE